MERASEWQMDVARRRWGCTRKSNAKLTCAAEKASRIQAEWSARGGSRSSVGSCHSGWRDPTHADSKIEIHLLKISMAADGPFQGVNKMRTPTVSAWPLWRDSKRRRPPDEYEMCSKRMPDMVSSRAKYKRPKATNAAARMVDGEQDVGNADAQLKKSHSMSSSSTSWPRRRPAMSRDGAPWRASKTRSRVPPEEILVVSPPRLSNVIGGGAPQRR